MGKKVVSRKVCRNWLVVLLLLWLLRLLLFVVVTTGGRQSRACVSRGRRDRRT